MVKLMIRNRCSLSRTWLVSSGICFVVNSHPLPGLPRGSLLLICLWKIWFDFVWTLRGEFPKRWPQMRQKWESITLCCKGCFHLKVWAHKEFELSNWVHSMWVQHQFGRKFSHTGWANAGHRKQRALLLQWMALQDTSSPWIHLLQELLTQI